MDQDQALLPVDGDQKALWVDVQGLPHGPTAIPRRKLWDLLPLNEEVPRDIEGWAKATGGAESTIRNSLIHWVQYRAIRDGRDASGTRTVTRLQVEYPTEKGSRPAIKRQRRKAAETTRERLPRVDDELGVMQVVVNLFNSLDNDARIRVAQWIGQRWR